MSSFVCSPEHFNSVEATLSLLIGRDTFPIWHKDFCKVKEWSLYDNIKAIVDTWRDLSVVCVTLQYAHHYNDINAEITEQREMLREIKKAEHLSEVQLYKALQCIHYQIEITHLKELRNLTQEEQYALDFMDFIIDAIGQYIISRLPEYDNAKWAI